MMDNPDDGDAGETSAVHEARGHHRNRDRSDAHNGIKSRTVCLWQTWMTGGFFTEGDDGDHTMGATPFWCGENQANHDLEHACAMQRRGGPGSNQGNGRVAEQTWLPGVDCQIGQRASQGRWSRWTSTVSCSLRFVEAGAESEPNSHCEDLQPKTAATPSRVGLTPGLLFDMSRSCWDLDVQANAERPCEYLRTKRQVLQDP